MKRNLFQFMIIGLIAAASCLVAHPSFLFADGGNANTRNPDTPQAVRTFDFRIAPENQAMYQAAIQTAANIESQLGSAANPYYSAITSQILSDLSATSDPDEQRRILQEGGDLLDRFRQQFLGSSGSTNAGPTTDLSPFIQRRTGEDAEDDRSSIQFNYGRSAIIKDLSDLDKASLNDYDETLLATWDKIDKFMEDWEKEMQKLFSADWEEQERISKVLDQQWQDKINELIRGIENQQAFVNAEDSEVIVLDAVDFTGQIQAIHRLLNPPARLHPWLKWLLYLHRVSPEMLQFYQAALEGRDRIYALASKSDGRLKIRYQGRIMDFALFPFPEDAEGRYELVMVRGQNALISPNSSTPAAQATSALPPQ